MVSAIRYGLTLMIIITICCPTYEILTMKPVTHMRYSPNIYTLTFYVHRISNSVNETFVICQVECSNARMCFQCFWDVTNI